jgi:hypothetical protein
MLSSGTVNTDVMGLEIGRGLERLTADLAPRGERPTGVLDLDVALEFGRRGEARAAELAPERGNGGHDRIPGRPLP